MNEGNPISGPMLIEKAYDFYKQTKFTESSKPCAFLDKWLACFNSCHGIRRLDMSGEKQIVEHAAAKSSSESLKIGRVKSKTLRGLGENYSYIPYLQMGIMRKKKILKYSMSEERRMKLRRSLK
jgi:hypothetical protein